MKAPLAARAIMEQRHEPPNALDDFPTPPWATRALVEKVVFPPAKSDGRDLGSVWEPAAGRGLMSEVLKEYASKVWASDVFDYGKGYALGSFVGGGFDEAVCPFRPDWVITNPPFNEAERFFERARTVARRGVALLLRLSWLDSLGRYENVFAPTPPSVVAVFSERCPMHRGRWEPDGGTATCYAWFVWSLGQRRHRQSRLMWIPPGQREALERPDDRARFAPNTITHEPSLFTAKEPAL